MGQKVLVMEAGIEMGGGRRGEDGVAPPDVRAAWVWALNENIFTEEPVRILLLGVFVLLKLHF